MDESKWESFVNTVVSVVEKHPDFPGFIDTLADALGVLTYKVC